MGQLHNSSCVFNGVAHEQIPDKEPVHGSDVGGWFGVEYDTDVVVAVPVDERGMGIVDAGEEGGEDGSCDDHGEEGVDGGFEVTLWLGWDWVVGVQEPGFEVEIDDGWF